MELASIISYALLGLLVASILILVLWKKDNYYVIYNRRLLFVIGLVFSRSLTDYTITSVLIWYLTYDGDDLVISAVFASIQSSSSSLFVIFMAHAADSYVGRFSTLLFSNTAYIGGLTLLWLFNPWDTRWLIVISVVLLSLGTSGDYILEDVLLDLVNDVDKSQNRTKARSRARAKIWSRVAYMFGAISATLWVAVDATGGFYEPSWSSSLLICIITMTATLVIFCMGHNIYHQGELTKRPVEVFLRVFHDRVHKCNPRCFTNFSRQDRLPQNLQTGKTGNEDMVVVKSLLKMFPMWGLFFVVSIISATGFTFFLKQYSNLNVSNKIPIQVFGMDQDLSRFVIPLLYNRIRCLPKNEKFKIGVGMLCGILSCIFAWKVEVYRLKEVDRLVDKDSTTSMSFLWLVPQFCALGCMEGLTIEGLLKFYRSQIKEKSLQSYGEEYIEIVMGLGKVINIFLILVFNSKTGWFRYTINNSRLDKYYKVLVCIGSANFISYCCVSRYFYKAQDLANDDQEQDNQVFPDNHDQAQAN